MGLSFFIIVELTGLGVSPDLFVDETFKFYNSWTITHYEEYVHLLHNVIYSASAGGTIIFYMSGCYVIHL